MWRILVRKQTSWPGIQATQKEWVCSIQNKWTPFKYAKISTKMPIDGNINGWAVRHVLFSQRLGTLALLYPSNGCTCILSMRLFWGVGIPVSTSWKRWVQSTSLPMSWDILIPTVPKCFQVGYWGGPRKGLDLNWQRWACWQWRKKRSVCALNVPWFVSSRLRCDVCPLWSNTIIFA